MTAHSNAPADTAYGPDALAVILACQADSEPCPTPLLDDPPEGYEVDPFELLDRNRNLRKSA